MCILNAHGCVFLKKCKKVTCTGGTRVCVCVYMYMYDSYVLLLYPQRHPIRSFGPSARAWGLSNPGHWAAGQFFNAMDVGFGVVGETVKIGAPFNGFLPPGHGFVFHFHLIQVFQRGRHLTRQQTGAVDAVGHPNFHWGRKKNRTRTKRATKDGDVLDHQRPNGVKVPVSPA